MKYLSPKGFPLETTVTYKEEFLPMTDETLSYRTPWRVALDQNLDGRLNSENQGEFACKCDRCLDFNVVFLTRVYT